MLIFHNFQQGQDHAIPRLARGSVLDEHVSVLSLALFILFYQLMFAMANATVWPILVNFHGWFDTKVHSIA